MVEDRFASKFAALSRKDAELRAQSDEVKALKRKAAELEAQLEATKAKPVVVKLSVEDEILALKAQLALQAEEKAAAEKKAALDADTTAETNWRAEIAERVKESTTHEFLKDEEASTDDIMRVMTEHWNSNKTIMPYSEALDAVEAYYEAKFVKRAALAKAKKIVGVSAPPAPPEVTPAAPSVTSAKTLTGSFTSQTPARSEKDTADDKMARAIKIIQDAHR